MPKVKKNLGKSTFLQSRVAVVLSNWINQGIRYMTIGEGIYTLLVSLSISLLIWSTGLTIWCSLFIAHSLNWIFNGQLFVLVRFLSNKDVFSREKLLKFVKILKRLNAFFRVDDVLLTGSVTKGQMTTRSDLDVRIFVTEWYRLPLSYVFATILRVWALLNAFPLDVYCFSNWSFMGPRKINESEVPVHLLGCETVLSRYARSISLDDCLKTLKVEKLY